jgi:uncharacterized membrane protein YciS (DUF1049 family)
MLIAGIIVAVYSLLFNYTIERTAYTIFAVLVVFFVIGTILQAIINKIITSAESAEQEKVKKALDEAANTIENNKNKSP